MKLKYITFKVFDNTRKHRKVMIICRMIAQSPKDQIRSKSPEDHFLALLALDFIRAVITLLGLLCSLFDDDY